MLRSKTISDNFKQEVLSRCTIITSSGLGSHIRICIMDNLSQFESTSYSSLPVDREIANLVMHSINIQIADFAILLMAFFLYRYY